jgi:outer membrane lipoprotein-sorting protein
MFKTRPGNRLKEAISMKRLGLTLLVVTGLTFGAFAQVILSDQEILERVDQARFIGADSFVMTLKVTSQRPEEEVNEAVLAVYGKSFDGRVRKRIEFLETGETNGTVYLVAGVDTYFYQYGHGLEQPLRMSGQQKLFGDAGIAEAAGISFAKDYTIRSKEETTLNEQESLLLHLESQTASYRLISLWVNKETYRPQQAILYALSGEPLKRVIYKEYDEFESDEHFRKIIIENLLQEDYLTTIEVIDISVEELPDEMFDPETLTEKNEKSAP